MLIPTNILIRKMDIIAILILLKWVGTYTLKIKIIMAQQKLSLRTNQK